MATSDLVTCTDKVKLIDNRVGIVKFVGSIEGKRGVWIGIELAKGRGKNSGNKIFPCAKNKGVFIKKNQIQKVKIVDDSVPRYTIGTQVDVPGKGLGVIRYIGYPAFKNQRALFYGIHLEEKNGKSNGRIDGVFYFKGADKRAAFLPVQRLAGCAVSDGDEKENSPEPEADAGDAGDDEAVLVADGDDDNAPAATEDAAAATSDDDNKDSDEYVVGDCVMIDKDKKGQLKFVGEDKNTKKLGPGTWYGVRLQEPRGECNGTYKGVKYFRCPDKFGLMVPGRRIKRRLNDDEVDFDFSADAEPTQEELEAAARLEEGKARKRKMAAVKAKFKEMDSDGNLVLDIAEFTKVMSDSMSGEDAESVFAEIDVSASGEISFAEFDSWLRAQDGDDSSAVGSGDSAAAAVAREEIAEDVAETEAEIAAADAAADDEAPADNGDDAAGDADEAQGNGVDENESDS